MTEFARNKESKIFFKPEVIKNEKIFQNRARQSDGTWIVYEVDLSWKAPNNAKVISRWSSDGDRIF